MGFELCIGKQESGFVKIPWKSERGVGEERAKSHLDRVRIVSPAPCSKCSHRQSKVVLKPYINVFVWFSRVLSTVRSRPH